MSDDKKDPKNDKKQQRTIVFGYNDNDGEADSLLSKAESLEEENPNSIAGILSTVASERKKKQRVPRLAFEADPNYPDVYNGLRTKRSLMPDSVLRDIRVSDHLIASILRARGNTMSMFGHIRKDRFDIGIEVKIKPELEALIDPEQMEKVRERIARFENFLVRCGSVEGLKETDKMSLTEFLYLQTQNALTFGRFATEIVYDHEGDEHPERGKVNRFRPVDVSTIYRAVRMGGAEASNLRGSSEKALSDLTGEKVKVHTEFDDEYPWVQQVEGMKRQAFRQEEMLVFNVYPTTDTNKNGYPVSPIDTCMSSVTTHLSIEAYNKLFFQNGRGAKGMLVIQSDDIDQASLDNIRQQYQASINSVSNSFRTPIFGMGKEDNVQWVGLQSSSTDGEFQFLYDQVARNILSAFNMSPDELPGYGHLSRGTNTQSLSESNNEFKLTAARDTGIRPLILKWEEFLNTRLFPLIEPELSQLCVISLSGLDAQSREQEAVRLEQESRIHMTYDEILSVVDKPKIGDYLGGRVPFSAQYQLVMDKYLDVGLIAHEFLDDPTAILDPMLKYKRDGFAMQQMQLLMQTNPDALKAMFASRPDAHEMMMFLIEDYLEEMGE